GVPIKGANPRYMLVSNGQDVSVVSGKGSRAIRHQVMRGGITQDGYHPYAAAGKQVTAHDPMNRYPGVTDAVVGLPGQLALAPLRTGDLAPLAHEGIKAAMGPVWNPVREIRKGEVPHLGQGITFDEGDYTASMRQIEAIRRYNREGMKGYA